MSSEFSENIKFMYIHKSDYTSNMGPHPGYKVPDQSHPFCEVVFYSQGCVGKTVIDGVEYSFRDGDIAFIQKDIVHSEEHYANGVLYFFAFDINSDNFDLPQNGIYSNMWDIKLDLNVMLKEMVNQNINYKKMISLKICEIILHLQRKANNITNHTKNLNFIKNYIDNNYMQNITIESLAKTTGYSPSHFRNLFTKAFGISPKNYIIDTRLKNAADLLKNTSTSCTEIAYRCGFSTSNQLSTLFKRKYKISPLDYRKNL